MTDHTYLRYECADAFGLAVDHKVSIVHGISTTSTTTNLLDTIWTTAGSQALQWNVSTASLRQKLAPPSSDTIGSGQALTSDSITALATTCEQQQQQNVIVATGWNTGTVRVFECDHDKNDKTFHSILDDTKAGLTEPSVVLQGHESAVQSLAFFPDGTKLASGGANGAVVVWDLVAETGLFRLLGHSRDITSLSFWNQHFLLSTSLDGLVKVWDLEGQCCTQTIASHNGQVWSGTLIQGASKGSIDDARCRLITGSVNGQVRVWNVEPPKRLQANEQQMMTDGDNVVAVATLEDDDATNKDDV